MTRTLGRLLLSLTAILFPAVLSGQELLSGSLSKDTVLIGDHVEWKALFDVPSDLTMDFDSLANPVVPGVEVISHFTLDTLSKKKKIIRVEARAVITSFDSGEYMLPDRVFYFYRDGEEVDTLHFDGMPLVVNTIEVDTSTFMSPERAEGDDTPRFSDIKPQFRYPVTFMEVARWVLAFALLAAVIYGVVIVVRRKKAGLTITGHPVTVDPPHIVALRALDRIHSQELWQKNRQKQFYTEITDALRLYLEGRFDIQALESTSAEILAELSGKDIRPDEYESLSELFRRSDLVKFAKYSCTREENENAIPTAVRFVNETYERKIGAQTEEVVRK